MSKALDRVRKLIAQAVDPAVSEEEARSFALIAVKLIVEHKLLDQPPPAPSPPPYTPPPPPWGAPSGYPGGRHRPPPIDPSTLEHFWETFVRAAGMAGAPFPGSIPRPAHAPRARRHVEPTYPRNDPPWWDRLPCELWIYAERPCEVCGKPCHSGELVWAYEMASDHLGGLPSRRPRVVHMQGCRDKLPEHQRRRKAAP